MTVATELIVLNLTRFQENQAVLHVLSRDRGRAGLMVSSKGGTALFQPMNILEADVTENPRSTLWRARHFSAKWPLGGIRGDIRKNCMTMFMGEVLFKAIKEGERDERVYDWAERSILTLDALESDFSNYHLRFLLEFAVEMGFSPDFDSIAPFAGENLDKMQALLRSDLAESLLIPLTGVQRTEMAESLIRYLEYHTESAINIKSLGVLRELFR